MKTFKRTLSVLLAVLMAFGALTVAYAADPEDSAVAGTVGTASEGNLSALDEVDCYSFAFTAAGFAKVKFTTPGTGSEIPYYTVTVSGPDKKDVLSFNVDGNDVEAVSPDFYVGIGTYYVKVAAGSAFVEDKYSVTLIAVAPVADAKTETESNNTTSTATAASLDTWYYGAVGKGDVDYYSFTAKQGLFSIDCKKTDGKRGNFRFEVIQLVGKEEKIFASFDYTESSKDLVYGSEIGSNAGTYYVKVSGVDGSCGSYCLRVFAKADSSTEAEYNDVVAYANEIKADGLLFGAITAKDDVDMFKIVHAENRTAENTKTFSNTYKVVINAALSTTDAVWKVEVFKPSADGVVNVFEGNVSATQAATINFNAFEPGTYYIKISAGSNYRSDDYKLTISTEKNELKLSTIEQIKALFSSDGFKNLIAQFKELIGNIDLIYTIVNLFSTSIGTIFKWIRDYD